MRCPVAYEMMSEEDDFVCAAAMYERTIFTSAHISASFQYYDLIAVRKQTCSIPISTIESERKRQDDERGERMRMRMESH